MAFLLFKIVATLIVVLGIAWATERFGPRAGAIASGFPNTMALILLFNGLAFGSEFVRDGIPFSMASLSCAMIFGTAWGFASALPISLVLAPVTALFIYGVAAYGLSFLTLTIFSSTIIGLVAIYVFHNIHRLFPEKRFKTKPMNTYELLLRVVLVVGVVITISEVSGYLGPKYAGILSGFPANVLPLFIILHVRYGSDAVRSFLRHWPEKLLSAFAYLFVLYFLLQKLPFIWAWALAMGGSIVLSMFFVMKKKSAKSF